ncbi:MAG: DUF5320 domain-containing protein [Bacteroidales bacterium]
MPKLDRTGPEGEAPLSGRKLGKCRKSSDEEKLEKLGKGMGKKRKSGGGSGLGKRLKSNQNSIN